MMTSSQKKHKYLAVSPDFPPPFEGGSLVYIYNLLANSGLDFTVFTSTVPDEYRGREGVLPSNIKVIRSPLLVRSLDPRRIQLAKMYAWLPLRTAFALAFGGYGALVSSAGPIGNALCVAVAVALGKPVFVVSYAEELTIPLYSGGWKNSVKKFLLKKFYTAATAHITVCGFTKKVLESLGIKPDKVEVIPPASSVSKISATDKSDKQKRGVTVLSVGRLVPRKGFDLLIKAAVILKNKMPEVEVRIVGRGPERARLDALVKELGLADTVFLEGDLSDDALAGLYARGDIFALANIRLPNGDVEGCPTVLIEASAAGLPVVAGTQGGADAAVENGVNGYLTDPSDTAIFADTILHVLSDKNLAARMGEAGKRRADTLHNAVNAGKKFGSFIEDITYGKYS